METAMPAYASTEPAGIPLSRSSTLVGVYRYFPSNPQKYIFLPNISVIYIQYRDGADPGVARFLYVFDESNDPSNPNSFQDALSINSTLPGVVQNDDRLVVLE